MPLLIVKLPGGATLLKRLSPAGLSIGRAGDLALGDPSLSRLHAEIRCEDGTWILRDLGSRNGTLLDRRRIDGAVPLADRSEVLVGDIAFIFVADESTVPGIAGVTEDGRSDGSIGAGSTLLGDSAATAEVRRLISIVAPSEATVLVTGESGTGKELVAREIHRASRRRGEPFVVVNCPAIPAQLFESELFGIGRGVATGVHERLGLIETARGGSLFLDEVGDIDTGAQAKLLRFLQERTIDRIGARSSEKVDVRVIAATNRDLVVAVASGAFRQDLYFRLSAFPIPVPPLRERLADVPRIAEAFLAARGSRAGISPEAMELLVRHDYPGNVRELENVLERAVLLALGGRLEAEHLPAGLRETRGARAIDDAQAAAVLLERILCGESFWNVVREPFLRRELSKERARLLVLQGLDRAGGSYKELARMARIADYKKLMNFLRTHGLQPER
jgi:transcriptional regulator with GAF, ATPase, and Fis domain